MKMTDKEQEQFETFINEGSRLLAIKFGISPQMLHAIQGGMSEEQRDVVFHWGLDLANEKAAEFAEAVAVRTLAERSKHNEMMAKAAGLGARR